MVDGMVIRRKQKLLRLNSLKIFGEFYIRPPMEIAFTSDGERPRDDFCRRFRAAKSDFGALGRKLMPYAL
jgi:hypothetical protein